MINSKIFKGFQILNKSPLCFLLKMPFLKTAKLNFTLKRSIYKDVYHC